MSDESSETKASIHVGRKSADVYFDYGEDGDGADSWEFSNMTEETLRGLGEMFILAAEIVSKGAVDGWGLSGSLSYKIKDCP